LCRAAHWSGDSATRDDCFRSDYYNEIPFPPLPSDKFAVTQTNARPAHPAAITVTNIPYASAQGFAKSDVATRFGQRDPAAITVANAPFSRTQDFADSDSAPRFRQRDPVAITFANTRSSPVEDGDFTQPDPVGHTESSETSQDIN
jgi:hypothetical protein